jgi:hypothetical protein
MANHISHAALPYPIKGARFTTLLDYIASDGTPTDPTTPDTEISKDAGAFSDCAEEVTTISGSNGAGMITFSGAEMDCSAVIVVGKVASGPKPFRREFYPRQLVSIATGTLAAGSAGGGTLGTILFWDIAGCFIKTTGGTGGGGTGGANNQARKIMTYNVTTGAFTVAPNWETTVSTDTTYDILLPEGVTLGMLKAFAPLYLNNGRRIPELAIADRGTGTISGAVFTLQSGHGYSNNTANGKTLVFWGTTAGTEPQSQVVVSSSGDNFTLKAAPTETPTGTISYVMFDTPPSDLDTAIGTLLKIDGALENTGGTWRPVSNWFANSPAASDPRLVRSVTATAAGSANTFPSTGLTSGSPPQTYVGKFIEIDSGTGVGHVGFISAQNLGASPPNITFWPALPSGTIANGNTARILKAPPVQLAGITHTSAAIPDVTAVKAKTDQLTFTQTGHVDANMQRVNDVLL